MEQIENDTHFLNVPRDNASKKTFFAKPSFLPNEAAAQTCRACTGSAAAAVLPHQEEEGHQLLAWRVGAAQQRYCHQNMHGEEAGRVVDASMVVVVEADAAVVVHMDVLEGILGDGDEAAEARVADSLDIVVDNVTEVQEDRHYMVLVAVERVAADRQNAIPVVAAVLVAAVAGSTDDHWAVAVVHHDDDDRQSQQTRMLDYRASRMNGVLQQLEERHHRHQHRDRRVDHCEVDNDCVDHNENSGNFHQHYCCDRDTADQQRAGHHVHHAAAGRRDNHSWTWV